MHPRAALRIFLVVSVALVACLAVSGCGKQQKQAPSAKMPQVSKETTPAADTADIFKEFYSEDSAKNKAAGAKSKKAPKQETFSPSSSSSFQPEFSSTGRYTVQITCVKSKAFADQMTGKMKEKGYPAYVAKVDNPTPNLSGTYYRVRIGGFNGITGAKSFAQNILTPSGYQYWVDKKSNDNVGMEGYGLGSGNAGSTAAGSYDNAPAAGATSSYQSTPASTPAETPSGSTYISPSSSSYQQSPATAAPAQAAPSAPPAAASSPAASTSQPSTPASSSSQASPPPATSSGAAGSTAKTGTGNESGWGTDSASKSGW